MKDILVRQYDNIFDIKRFRDYESKKHELSTLGNDANKIELIQGHQYFGLHKYVGKFKYITLMRNPIDKVISLYKSYRRKSDCPQHETALKYSFKEFIKSRHDLHFDNGMVRIFSNMELDEPGYGLVKLYHLKEACDNLEKYFYVGLTENFNESIVLFSNLLNWRSYPLYTKASFAKKSEDFEIEDGVLNLIKQENKLDIKLYNFGRRLFYIQLSTIPNIDRKVKIFEMLNNTIGKFYIRHRLGRLIERKVSAFN